MAAVALGYMSLSENKNNPLECRIGPLIQRIRDPWDLRSFRIDELHKLAKEIRELICRAVCKNGGHLASNLGVVELTIAMHLVFDFAKDYLVWDVGHQCYVHKILTGRAGAFDQLRQSGGISGFPDPAESEYDRFAVGHAGTAAATAGASMPCASTSRCRARRSW